MTIPSGRQCPFCAETVQVDAKKCRYCGEWLVDPQYRPARSEDAERARHVVITVTVISIVIGFMAHSGLIFFLTWLVGIGIALWWYGGVTVLPSSTSSRKQCVKCGATILRSDKICLRCHTRQPDME